MALLDATHLRFLVYLHRPRLKLFYPAAPPKGGA